MHPLISEYLAQVHGDELVREAAIARRVSAARSRGARPARPASPVRRALGLRLVDVGLRLAGSR